MAWNISTRPIFLVRCGTPVGAIGGSASSPFNVDKNAPLSEEGVAFSMAVGSFIRKRCAQWSNDDDVRLSDGTLASGSMCKVMTSTVPRAFNTAVHANVGQVEQFPHLNPLDRGVMHSLSPDEIGRVHPNWVLQWNKDPLHTRFPGGESYSDVVLRLEPCLVEMEQQVAPVLVVSHVTVLQILIAYFTRRPIRDVQTIEIPMNAIVEMLPKGDGHFDCHYTNLGMPISIPGYRVEKAEKMNDQAAS
eukprot:c15005_g1_i2.p1 GENE.c15005_g1_i2~~c15005_g1_i2.p1  ORF type:complete len:246 (+),score=51.35 c15005_g1_i2:1030-1767(+)